MTTRSDPVILLGMHRSGTTLLAQMLAQMGMHLGRNLESHDESVFFLDANDWVLERAHGGWDQPLPILGLLEHEASRQTLVAELRRRVNGISYLRRYVGPRLMRRFNSDAPLLWGWKDPRTTSTWPLWLEVFPRARAITVHRNGVDVAASLWRRAKQEMEGENRVRYLSDPHIQRFLSPRCLRLERAFQLWEEYLDLHAWCRERHELPELVMRYEDLLQDPMSKLREIARFLDLPEEGPGIENAAALVDKGPRLRFLEDEILGQLYRDTKERPWMKQLGYDAYASSK